VFVEFLRKVEFLEGGAEGIERPEPEDFEHIYPLYSRRVYSLCLRIAGNIEVTTAQSPAAHAQTDA
jgi:hypothetical protein